MTLLEAKMDRVVDVRSNALHLRLAETEEEVAAAQALRYRVFYEEMSAKATAEMAAAKRDFDAFDAYCDHMVVFDSARGAGPEAIIGTYRVMRREAAKRCGRFYTAGEYDIANLLAYPGGLDDGSISGKSGDYGLSSAERRQPPFDRAYHVRRDAQAGRLRHGYHWQVAPHRVCQPRREGDSAR